MPRPKKNVTEKQDDPKTRTQKKMDMKKKKIVTLAKALGVTFGRTRLVLPGGRVRAAVNSAQQYRQYEALNNDNFDKARSRDDLPTECGFCLRTFNDRRNAVEHIEAKHKGKPKTFVCNCGGEFARLANLRKHLRTAKVHNN